MVFDLKEENTGIQSVEHYSKNIYKDSSSIEKEYINSVLGREREIFGEKIPWLSLEEWV